jgi:hypothetical protein
MVADRRGIAPACRGGTLGLGGGSGSGSDRALARRGASLSVDQVLTRIAQMQKTPQRAAFACWILLRILVSGTDSVAQISLRSSFRFCWTESSHALSLGCSQGREAVQDGYPDLQRIRIDPQVNLAPLARLGRPVFYGEPRTFALGFDPGVVDQEVKRTSAGTIRNGDVQTFLAARQRAEVRHRPIESGECQQACHQSGRLPQWQPEQRLQRQARLDSSVGERPRFPLGSANNTVSGSNQISSEPRCFRAALSERRSSCGRSEV